MIQPEYTIEFNAADLFTLESLCKALRELGSLDWQESEFTMRVTFTPTTAEVHANFERFVRHQTALGQGGLGMLVSPRIR